MTTIRRLSRTAALAAVFVAPLAFAQAPPDDRPEITQLVARVSYVDGDVSYARGDEPNRWQPVDHNVPLTLGDRVYAPEGARAELELHGGEVIRLGSNTDLTALDLTRQTRQFALKSGVAFFRVPALDRDELFEVDSPNAAVTFERSGEYRIDVDADGNTRVSVHKGNATIAAGGGQVSVGADAGIRIDGFENPRYEVIALPEVDAWDRWAGERESRLLRAHSRRYVSAAVPGVEDLDDYGQWSKIPQYGWAWSPSSVSTGWAPYRAGRWIWQDPWGWTWVSTEPWGWAPYHSGRWVFASARWFWIPVAPAIRVVPYAPALVAFVGGGPGFSASVTVGGGGFVGWFPLAPRDPLVRWWGYQDEPRVTQVTNVTYVNQTYVTVVNQTTFVSGLPVSESVITDRAVVRQAAAAPVVRGAIPVIPTNESTRSSLKTGVTAPQPPPAVATRQVVTRVAPPPAPQRFAEKVALIRQSGGVPVASTHRAPAEGNAAPRAAAEVRPASAAPGKVTLAPHGNPTGNTPQRVEPIVPPKGRTLATQEQPVARVVEGSKPPVVERSSRPGAQPEPAPAVERGKPAPQNDRPEARFPQAVAPPERSSRPETQPEPAPAVERRKPTPQNDRPEARSPQAVAPPERSSRPETQPEPGPAVERRKPTPQNDRPEARFPQAVAPPERSSRPAAQPEPPPAVERRKPTPESDRPEARSPQAVAPPERSSRPETQPEPAPAVERRKPTPQNDRPEARSPQAVAPPERMKRSMGAPQKPEENPTKAPATPMPEDRSHGRNPGRPTPRPTPDEKPS